jgi:elongation factor P
MIAPAASRALSSKDGKYVKVAASSLRKGAVVDMDGKLYVVLTVDNIHPGKGTPVTQLNMRRISDGVKVSERYRTTEQVERAFVDQRNHTFLYQDGDGFHFMNPESFDQLVATEEVIGDAAPYLQENMTVQLSTHNDVPISIELPRTVVLEIVETEPSVKGQTASSSYKPAILSNGVRTTVPPYIAVGTKVDDPDGRQHVSRARQGLSVPGALEMQKARRSPAGPFSFAQTLSSRMPPRGFRDDKMGSC